jgi:hypothetical protein
LAARRLALARGRRFALAFFRFAFARGALRFAALRRAFFLGFGATAASGLYGSAAGGGGGGGAGGIIGSIIPGAPKPLSVKSCVVVIIAPRVLVGGSWGL